MVSDTRSVIWRVERPQVLPKATPLLVSRMTTTPPQRVATYLDMSLAAFAPSQVSYFYFYLRRRPLGDRGPGPLSAEHPRFLEFYFLLQHVSSGTQES